MLKGINKNPSFELYIITGIIIIFVIVCLILGGILGPIRPDSELEYQSIHDTTLVTWTLYSLIRGLERGIYYYWYMGK